MGEYYLWLLVKSCDPSFAVLSIYMLLACHRLHIFLAQLLDHVFGTFCRFEATRRIRAMEKDLNEQIERGEVPPECANVQQWRTPILAMTADVIQATYEECLKFEMDGYVSKPFEGEQLYREVARFFLNQDEVL